MKILTFSTIWGSRTGGIDVFHRDLVRALAQQEPKSEIKVCLQKWTPLLETDCKKYSFSYLTPTSEKPQSLASEDLGDWTEANVNSVLHRMSLGRDSFRPDVVLLNDIFCSAVLTPIRQAFPNAKIVTFIHSAYGRSEKRKDKPDTEIDRKIGYQMAMVNGSDLTVTVGSHSINYIKAHANQPNTNLLSIVPGLPNHTTYAEKATHFHAASFGRLDSTSDLLKQISVSAKAWNAARQSPGLHTLITQDATFYAIGSTGGESVLKALRDELKLTSTASLIELPFEDVDEFDGSAISHKLRKCAFVLLNSWYENFGLTFLETAVLGVPTIISQSSGFYVDLKSIIGEVKISELTLSVQTDGRLPQAIEADLKEILLGASGNYDNTFANAAALRALLLEKWPSWKTVAKQLISKIAELPVVTAATSPPNETHNAATQPDVPSIKAPSWPETIGDLSDWCWRGNKHYYSQILLTSPFRCKAHLPLTSLQKQFWEQREHYSTHPFRDLILSGGTSSGKTTIAEMIFGLARPKEFGRARILYIAPTKALAQEKAASWKETYPNTSMARAAFDSVIVSTGDDNASDGALMRGDFNIASTVFEKANILVSASRELFSKLNLIVIDEFHMVEDLQRGGVIESLLAKIQLEKARRIEGVNRDNDLRVIVITTEAADNFLSNYLTFYDDEQMIEIAPLALTDHVRPSRVTHNLVLPGRTSSLTSPVFELNQFEPADPLLISSLKAADIFSRFLAFRRDIQPIPEGFGYNRKRIRREEHISFIDSWMMQNRKGGRLLVFMNSKYEILELARQLKNHFVKKHRMSGGSEPVTLTPNKAGLQSVLDAIDSVEGTEFNSDLHRCASEGIFVHDADVASNVRRAFENYLATPLATESRSEIILSTETLSFGVNLQISDVFILNPVFPENERVPTGKKPEQLLLSRCDFINMSGRAGRLNQVSGDAHVYCFLDPDQDSSIENVLTRFYSCQLPLTSELVHRTDARVQRDLRTANERGLRTPELAAASIEKADSAVETFSYPFARAVLDGLRFLGGTENFTGFLGRAGCFPGELFNDFFAHTFYHAQKCSPIGNVSAEETRVRTAKESDLYSAIDAVLKSASGKAYGLVRKLPSNAFQITALGSSTIDTGTEIGTVTRLRQSLLQLSEVWSNRSGRQLPFELAVLPLFFQPEVFRRYNLSMPEYNLPMEWNADANRADLSSRIRSKLVSMKALTSAEGEYLRASLQDFVQWTTANQPFVGETGRYDEACHDASLRLYLAFLSWTSGASLRKVVEEIHTLYSGASERTNASVFNFEVFAENLTWKVLFLVSLIRASKEEILPRGSTFDAVRFVHRSRLGSSEGGVPMLSKNRSGYPPMNRVEVHKLLAGGYTSADVALDRMHIPDVPPAKLRRLCEHVRSYIRESFQELARQFNHFASGSGLDQLNEEIATGYWDFAQRQIDSIIRSATVIEGIWPTGNPLSISDLDEFSAQDREKSFTRLLRVPGGMKIEVIAPQFDNNDDDAIISKLELTVTAMFSFDGTDDAVASARAVDSHLFLVDFPWAAGARSEGGTVCRLSPAAFGVLLSLCARRFVVDSGQFLRSVLAHESQRPIGVRDLYGIAEKHINKGSFPETIFEAWAKYIEVGEY